MSLFRRRVSQNRRRYVNRRYDLDLTYIYNDIIAMGFPSDNFIQSLIRNDIHNVSKFLNEHHPECYKVFNLCHESDMEYSHLYFDNKVEKIPFEDHTPPQFAQILQFCQAVNEWLNENKENVAIVHCKAGKGRTGTMISCFLIYSNRKRDPFEALDEFSMKRCKDSKGVTIPSQRRYVEYFADYFNSNRSYQTVELQLNLVEIVVPNEQKTNLFFKSFILEIFKEGTKKFYETKKVKFDKKANMFRFELQSKNVQVKLKDDIKFCFLSRKKACVMRVVLNTFCFLQNNSYAFAEPSCQGNKELLPDGQILWLLKKKDIDVAFKNKNIHEDLVIKFYFRNISDQTDQEEERTKNEIEPIYRRLDSKSAISASDRSEKISEMSDDKANKSEEELQAELNAEKKLMKSSTTSGGHESDIEDNQQSDEHNSQFKEKQKRNFLLKKMKKVLLFSKKTNDTGENRSTSGKLKGKSTSESD